MEDFLDVLNWQLLLKQDILFYFAMLQNLFTALQTYIDC